MRNKNKDQQPENRHFPLRLFSWSSFITILFLGLTISSVLLAYLALQEPKAGVTFETISETNVLDLRRPLQDLDIVFRGRNVQDQNLNLRIVTVNVLNSGGVDILSNYYDPDDWGIKFNDSEVIEVRLVDTNSEYLRSKIVPQQSNAQTVVFPKVIFEEGASFAIEVLLLHPKDALPSISPVGKIAGIDDITVLTRPLAREEVSFAKELFQGSAVVQIVRTLIYIIGSALVFVLAVLTLIGISEVTGKVASRRRNNRILRSRSLQQIDNDEVRNFLVDYYRNRGTDGLKALRKLTKEPEEIKWVTPQPRWSVRHHMYVDRLELERELVMARRMVGPHLALTALTRTNFLNRDEEGNAVIDPALTDAVDALLDELGK